MSRLYTLTQHETFTLTLYVDIDQNRQANRKGGYLVQAEALLKDLRSRSPGDQGLEQAAGSALELIRSLAPGGKSALAVVHPGSGFAEVHTLLLPLPASLHWRRGAFLRPVMEAMDEHERYAFVLGDKQRARLFTVLMGEVEEHSDLFSDTPQRTRSTGADQWWSQKRVQRHHEHGVATHAKRVVDALHDLALRCPFDRLIIAGPIEAASHLARLLPKRMHGRLVDTIGMPVNATLDDVLGKTLEVQNRMERQQEALLVEGVVAELHEGGKAMAHLAPIVDAANQGRIWKLIYCKGFTADGGECDSCGCYTLDRSGPCELCGGNLRAAEGFVDRLSQGVAEQGGSVEVVHGPAAEKLEPLGSIAALLRY